MESAASVPLRQVAQELVAFNLVLQQLLHFLMTVYFLLILLDVGELPQARLAQKLMVVAVSSAKHSRE